MFLLITTNTSFYILSEMLSKRDRKTEIERNNYEILRTNGGGQSVANCPGRLRKKITCTTKHLLKKDFLKVST